MIKNLDQMIYVLAEVVKNTKNVAVKINNYRIPAIGWFFVAQNIDFKYRKINKK